MTKVWKSQEWKIWWRKFIKKKKLE